MTHAFLLIGLAIGAVCLARWFEGSVIAEELAEPAALLAMVILGLMLVFAFVIPEMNSQYIPRWHRRLFSSVPLIAWCAAAMPSAFSAGGTVELMSIQGIRKTGLVVLVFFFLLSVFV